MWLENQDKNGQFLDSKVVEMKKWKNEENKWSMQIMSDLGFNF